ncbi:hypothetical protein YPPY66_4140 [Yersinia pestis PY-66]|uniref:Uncharacterized protein n=1 Tax=Yersinia pestis biovar Orientalis str. IP275 TaxID=373665 RepID=A0AAV3BJ96_YERPE|nr:hypothetical protein YpAngola_A0957 [Yersinia pestis Angola]EDR34042.1 hypothetical protein YPIP275_4173 [Yersinia pestis biovar Orientalis str. IP275]EDR39496.1 hypothetical protein YpF1991016_2585 [Yersinia pestis biovar Orientalis str. F1991016]EDR43374.1 hypothetical protein YpE1979001_2258 [Yersinia pestis biovar Antiqua str. E1979001]EDR50258.1 hypothetical protein YpB42003004_3558 [Yersinia pestis biovar Antiqua str. B42003004]EDR56466.1 hypothetical protein YpMG051020_1017 [Yersinia
MCKIQSKLGRYEAQKESMKHNNGEQIDKCSPFFYALAKRLGCS